MAFMIPCIALSSDSVNWHSYEEGMAIAKIEKKKLFVHFFADWCAYCLKMAKDTFQNSAVVYFINEHFLPIMVNFDKEPETAAKYGVRGLPFTMILTEMGEPIISMPGYIPPDPLLSALKEVNAITSGN
jgi:thioredoxin-related protein